MVVNRWLLLAILGGATWWLFPTSEIRHAPGMLVSQPPLQSTADGAAVFQHLGYSIKPLARFELSARVLGREDYRFDRGADLAPVDLVLGWGPMSDQHILDNVQISQSGRWYRWRTSELLLPRQEIQHNSANMHLIPGSEAVIDRLEDVRSGHTVRLSGYLVEVSASDGWRWRSSLTRRDVGAGSCELIFVERLSIIVPPT